MKKRCCLCKKHKEYFCFGKSKSNLDGHRYECKDCRKQKYYENHEKSLERRRLDYYKHKEKRLESCKNYYQQYKESIKQKVKNYYHNNKEKVKTRSQEYRQKQENKDRRNQLHKERMKNDPNYVLGRRLRLKIYKLMKQNKVYKNNSSLELLGCSLDYFKQHIENQFKGGISWENIGTWHLDHYLACSLFNLTKTDHQRKCFSYQNIQPLWESDNCRKAAQDKKFKKYILDNNIDILSLTSVDLPKLGFYV